MKNYFMGFLIAYTILLTAFTYGLYTGEVASIQQACVERTSVVPTDFVSELDRKGRK